MNNMHHFNQSAKDTFLGSTPKSLSLCLHYLNQLISRKEIIDLQQHHTEIINLWEKFSSTMKDLLSDNDYEKIQFAVAAFTDEYMLSLDHPEAISWMQKNIQNCYFKTSDAGNKFYNNMIDAIDKKNYLVSKVYMLCVKLGFIGKLEKLDNQDSYHNDLIQKYNDSIYKEPVRVEFKSSFSLFYRIYLYRSLFACSTILLLLIIRSLYFNHILSQLH